MISFMWVRKNIFFQVCVLFLLIFFYPAIIYSNTTLTIYHPNPQLSPYHYRSDIDRLIISLAWFGCSKTMYSPSWFSNNWKIEEIEKGVKMYTPLSEIAGEMIIQWKKLKDKDIDNPRKYILRNIKLENNIVIEENTKGHTFPFLLHSTALLPADEINKRIKETDFGFEIQTQDCLINIYNRIELLIADLRENKIKQLILFSEDLKLDEFFFSRIGIEKDKIDIENHLKSDILIYIKFGNIALSLKKTLWYLLHNMKIENPFFQPIDNWLSLTKDKDNLLFNPERSFFIARKEWLSINDTDKKIKLHILDIPILQDLSHNIIDLFSRYLNVKPEIKIVPIEEIDNLLPNDYDIFFSYIDLSHLGIIEVIDQLPSPILFSKFPDFENFEEHAQYYFQTGMPLWQIVYPYVKLEDNLQNDN